MNGLEVNAEAFGVGLTDPVHEIVVILCAPYVISRYSLASPRLPYVKYCRDVKWSNGSRGKFELFPLRKCP